MLFPPLLFCPDVEENTSTMKTDKTVRNTCKKYEKKPTSNTGKISTNTKKAY
jgi:hypothetical protein